MCIYRSREGIAGTIVLEKFFRLLFALKLHDIFLKSACIGDDNSLSVAVFWIKEVFVFDYLHFK